MAGSSGYDVVVPTATFLARQIRPVCSRSSTKSKLPNLSNMWDVVQQKTAIYDPDNAYSINYMWGTTGIGYNKKKIAERLGTDKIDSWKTIFDPVEIAKLADCGVYMLDWLPIFCQRP